MMPGNNLYVPPSARDLQREERRMMLRTAYLLGLQDRKMEPLEAMQWAKQVVAVWQGEETC
jgi:hypothetical protein